MASRLTGLDAHTAGQLLRAARLRAGLTQEQIVTLSTVPNAQYLSALENGRYHVGRSEHFPSLAQAAKLSEAEVISINPSAVFHLTGSNQSIHEVDGRNVPSQGLSIINPTQLVTVPIYPLEALDPEISPRPAPTGVKTMLVSDYNETHIIVEVTDQRMAPALCGGGHLAFDNTQKTLEEGRIYGVRTLLNGQMMAIMRARVMADGHMWLVADNPIYPSLTPDQVYVCGRAVRYFPKAADL